MDEQRTTDIAQPRYHSRLVRALRAAAIILLILFTVSLIAVMIVPAYLVAHPDLHGPPPRIAPW
jgi:hypothetical protein